MTAVQQPWMAFSRLGELRFNFCPSLSIFRRQHCAKNI